MDVCLCGLRLSIRTRTNGTGWQISIVLGVKPQIIAAVAKQINTDLSGKLIFSIAAGITIEDLIVPVAIARTVLNTTAFLGLGATGLYVNGRTTEAQRVAAQVGH